MYTTDMDTFAIIISKSGCQACENAKKYMQENNIFYLYTEFKNLSLEWRRMITNYVKENNLTVSYPIIYIINPVQNIFDMGFNPQLLNTIFNFA